MHVSLGGHNAYVIAFVHKVLANYSSIFHNQFLRLEEPELKNHTSARFENSILDLKNHISKRVMFSNFEIFDHILRFLKRLDVLLFAFWFFQFETSYCEKLTRISLVWPTIKHRRTTDEITMKLFVKFLRAMDRQMHIIPTLALNITTYKNPGDLGRKTNVS